MPTRSLHGCIYGVFPIRHHPSQDLDDGILVSAPSFRGKGEGLYYRLFSSNAAWAAASRATGMRGAEQET